MRGALGLFATALLSTVGACAGPEPASSGAGPTPGLSSAGPERAASAAATAPAASAAPARARGEVYPCGALTCRDYDSAAAALGAILDESKPLIVAFGESHAQKGGEQVRSTTARFTEELLPAFEGKASALVLELWAGDSKCGKEKVKAVEQKQKVVTEKQAEGNQSEFVKLGEKSRALGVVPFLLKPSCEEYDRVKAAKDDAVLVMLDVITSNMKARATALFEETAKKAPGKQVLLYGGALHNDVAPKKEREAWSFAADLDRLAPGRYVEVDLIVPEFIKDSESWKSMPWFAAYDRGAMGSRVVLITVAPRSYAVVFARSAP